jgi:hypothetical protein
VSVPDVVMQLCVLASEVSDDDSAATGVPTDAMDDCPPPRIFATQVRA